MITGGAAKKGSEIASNALTGDVYIRRWKSLKGTGKKKRETEHELHVNPLTLAVGAAAAGVAAVGAGIGLWFMQRKITADDGAEMVRIVDWHDPVQTYVQKERTVTVPVWHDPTYETVEIPIIGASGDIIGYRTKEIIATEGYIEYVETTDYYKELVITDGYVVVRTSKGGIPIKTFKFGPNEGPQATVALTRGEVARGWYYLQTDGEEPTDWGKRIYYRFKNDKKKTYGLDKRDGFGPDIDISFIG